MANVFKFAHESFSPEMLAEINNVRWHHRIELAKGFFSNSKTDVARKLGRSSVPHDLSGAVCVDIGTRDGGLAFEMEKRGALRVIANDYVEKTRFNFALAHRCIGSRVEFLRGDLTTLPFLKLPKFDVVNYMGVIYHVADPYLSLMAMREICQPDGLIVVESAVLDGGSYSLDKRELNHDASAVQETLGRFPNLLQYLPEGHVNSWVPSAEALKALCHDAGLEIIHEERWGDRVMYSTRMRPKPRFQSFYQQHPLRKLLGSIEPEFS